VTDAEAQFAYVPPEPLFDYEGGGETPDPDMLLEVLRNLVHTWVERGNGGLTPDEVGALVEAFDLLDDWMASGYLPPREWAAAMREPSQPYEPLRREQEIIPSPKYL